MEQVSELENEYLTDVFTESEVRAAIFQHAKLVDELFRASFVAKIALT